MPNGDDRTHKLGGIKQRPLGQIDAEGVCADDCWCKTEKAKKNYEWKPLGGPKTRYMRRVFQNGQYVILTARDPADLVAVNENPQYTLDHVITEYKITEEE